MPDELHSLSGQHQDQVCGARRAFFPVPFFFFCVFVCSSASASIILSTVRALAFGFGARLPLDPNFPSSLEFFFALLTSLACPPELAARLLLPVHLRGSLMPRLCRTLSVAVGTSVGAPSMAYSTSGGGIISLWRYPPGLWLRRQMASIPATTAVRKQADMTSQPSGTAAAAVGSNVCIIGLSACGTRACDGSTGAPSSK